MVMRVLNFGKFTALTFFDAKKSNKKRHERQKSYFSFFTNPNHLPGKVKFSLAFDDPRTKLFAIDWHFERWYKSGLGRNDVKNFFRS